MSPYLRQTAKQEEILHCGGKQLYFEHQLLLILDTDVPIARPAEFSSLYHKVLSQ